MINTKDKTLQALETREIEKLDTASIHDLFREMFGRGASECTYSSIEQYKLVLKGIRDLKRGKDTAEEAARKWYKEVERLKTSPLL